MQTTPIMNKKGSFESPNKRGFEIQVKSRNSENVLGASYFKHVKAKRMQKTPNHRYKKVKSHINTKIHNTHTLLSLSGSLNDVF